MTGKCVCAERTIIGLSETITLNSSSGPLELIARIDTGATKSSIDLSLTSKAGLGPVVDSRIVKNAHGVKLRPVIQAEIILGGKTIKAKFTLADRSHMKFPILIGQNILKKGFLIDPNIKHD